MLTVEQESKVKPSDMRRALQKAEYANVQGLNVTDLRVRFHEYAEKLRGQLEFNKSPDDLKDDHLEGLGFSKTQRKIVLLNEAKLNSLKKSEMLGMLCHELPAEEMRNLVDNSEDEETGENIVRGRLQKYSDELRLKVNFNDYKKFLKKHLLSEIQGEDKQDYLAEVVACNSALSGGIAYATSCYFWERQTSLIDAQLFYTGHLKTSVSRLGQPKTQVTISCDKKGEVTFHSEVQFPQMSIQPFSSKKASFFRRRDQAPLVTIENDFKITVPEDVSSANDVQQTNKFRPVEFQSGPLKVKRHIVPNMHLNQFLSKVFSDTPLSGSAGVFLQKDKPEQRDCKPNAIYVYVETTKHRFRRDTYTLKYCALDTDGTLITGNVPTGIKNIELNRDARKYLASVALSTPKKLEDIFKHPVANPHFAFDREQQRKKPVTGSPQVLKTLAVAVSTIEYTPPKKASRQGLFSSRSTQTTSSTATQTQSRSSRMDKKTSSSGG